MSGMKIVFALCSICVILAICQGKIDKDEEKCCREKGVPSVCFGYCERTTSYSARSGIIAGICEKWFKVIGKCRESLSNQCDGPDRTKDCCTSSAPCDVGQGDCDVDFECAEPLVCGINNCGPNFEPGADCCKSKHTSALSRRNTESCGKSLVKNKGRIIGGKEIVPHSEPWLLNLCYTKDSCGGCAGTLISQRLVLTAAHCDDSMYSSSRGEFHFVKIGGHNLHASDGEKVPISKWITHKDARPLSGEVKHGQWARKGGVDQDISILVLARNVRFTIHVQPICLPSKPNQDYSEKKMYVSGWGLTEILRNKEGVVEEYTQSDVPKRVKVIGVSSCHGTGCQFCKKRTMICGIGAKQYNATINEDSCGGDSGGPMVQYDEGTAVLSGIVSFGYGCGQIQVPAVYTKVDNFLPWINQLMKKYSLK